MVAITFSLYAEQSGGAPLWSEVQNVRVDAAGRYTVQLGSTKPDGLPVELFTSAQAQWLGVQLQGQAEQPRVMLLSVPYALKAADAETFGGKPPSAYMQTADSSGSDGSSGGLGLGQKVKNDHPLSLSGSGTTNYIPLWTNASNLSSSVIFQGTGHEIGIGTSNPVTPLEVTGNNSIAIVDVTQTGSSGAAVVGDITATSGNGYGVTGTTASPAGTGVVGVNTATSGTAVGTAGSSSSSSGAGVEGVADKSLRHQLRRARDHRKSSRRGRYRPEPEYLRRRLRRGGKQFKFRRGRGQRQRYRHDRFELRRVWAEFQHFRYGRQRICRGNHRICRRCRRR